MKESVLKGFDGKKVEVKLKIDNQLHSGVLKVHPFSRCYLLGYGWLAVNNIESIKLMPESSQ